MGRIWLLMVVLLVGIACTGTTAESPQGTLLILGSAEEEYVRGIVRAFELDTGINTGYVRLSSGEALDALREQRAAPPYSVWWGGPVDGYIAADAEGLLETYEPRGSAKIPQQYKDSNDHWTGIYVGVLGFAVNQDVLAANGLPEPTSWADLIHPIYRGQISMAHPATSGTGYSILATIMQLNDKDLERGFRYLAALHENVRTYERAGAAAARVAGRGDAAIGIVFSHDAVAAIEEGYSALRIVFPSEGTGYEIGAMGLVRNGPNNAEARRFMDWAVSQRAQELGPLFTAFQIPTNPDAKVPPKSARLSAIKTIDYDFQWAGQSRSTLLAHFVERIAPVPR